MKTGASIKNGNIGVYVSPDGTFNMSGGEISGNTSGDNDGGGVGMLFGTFNMSGGTISGNTARNGGGVQVVGTFTMTGGEISGNTATMSGGGVNINTGLFTMTGGTIKDNTATEYGGGVSAQYGTFNMDTQGKIKEDFVDDNNAPAGNGPNVYIHVYGGGHGTFIVDTADQGTGSIY